MGFQGSGWHYPNNSSNNHSQGPPTFGPTTANRPPELPELPLYEPLSLSFGSEAGPAAPISRGTRPTRENPNLSLDVGSWFEGNEHLLFENIGLESPIMSPPSVIHHLNADPNRRSSAVLSRGSGEGSSAPVTGPSMPRVSPSGGQAPGMGGLETYGASHFSAALFTGSDGGSSALHIRPLMPEGSLHGGQTPTTRGWGTYGGSHSPAVGLRGSSEGSVPVAGPSMPQGSLSDTPAPVERGWEPYRTEDNDMGSI
jgi:hypothetical protein